MRLTDKRRLELIERKDLVSIRGREYIALDVLDRPVELAAPEPDPAPEAETLKARTEQRREQRKADVEGTASSS
jgi:hypothetical protein